MNGVFPIYLQMLKDYGVYDYLAVPESSKNLNAILDTLKYYEIEDSSLEKVKRIIGRPKVNN